MTLTIMIERGTWRGEIAARLLAAPGAWANAAVHELIQSDGLTRQLLAELIADAPAERNLAPADLNELGDKLATGVRPDTRITTLAEAVALTPEALIALLYAWRNKQLNPPFLPAADQALAAQLDAALNAPLMAIAPLLNIDEPALLEALLEHAQTTAAEPSKIQTVDQFRATMQLGPGAAPGQAETLQRAADVLGIPFAALRDRLLDWESWQRWQAAIEAQAANEWLLLGFEASPSVVDLAPGLPEEEIRRELKEAVTEELERRRLLGDHGRIGRRLWRLLARVPDPTLQPLLDAGRISATRLADV